ncbi:hypothetical protein BK010_09225 [Tenericutes bacterium MO-XQ]|nr:hypothetical protein BK010_09225 [Tenericutes bacterium MO-XQ]
MFLLELISNPWLALAVLVGVLLIIREIVTWYWKINQIVRMQEEQQDMLEKIHKELSEINRKTK